MSLRPKISLRPLATLLAVCSLLWALLWTGAASAAEQTAWAIDMPGLGPIALYGKDPKNAIDTYVDGLVRRNAFPGKAQALRDWGRAMAARADGAKPVSVIADGRPLSGIELNNVNDLIGGDKHLATRRAFASGLAGAGVASVFFPPADSRAHIAARLASVQHLTLTGGDDIHPSLYGQPVTHANQSELNLVRDRYEIALVKAALASKLPIDGTCRGHQMLNVVSGGTLVQDIHADGLTVREHVAPGFQPMRHPVLLTRGSAFQSTIGGTRIRGVPSMHHEAVGKLGKGLSVSARSSDGVTEAIEGDNGRVRGYQFHAELAQRSAFSKAIFGSIATRARAYAVSRAR